MISIQDFIDQVREELVRSGGQQPRHETYNHFVNESNALQLSEQDFYKTILKPADKSIDWDAIQATEKQKIETQMRLEVELKEKEEEIANAPVYIDRLIKTAFEDGIVEGEELKKIFTKAASLQQNTTSLSLAINRLLDERDFKSYPKANFDAGNLKDTLTSTNWYNASLYASMTAPPPPGPEPRPWAKIIASLVLFLLAAGVVFYFGWYKGYLEDQKATRMYSYANSLTLRSSPAAGGNHNEIGNVTYGTEVLVYSSTADWAKCKAKGKKGYVAPQFLLPKKDFEELNGILADTDTRDAISTTKCRKALLNYFRSKDIMGKIDEQIQKEIYDSIQHKEVWQVFTKSKNSNPNTVAYPRLVSPNAKFTDFACLIKNMATGKRKFLLFSFDDTEVASLVEEQEAPDNGYISKITKRAANTSQQFHVSYTF
jgi:hypothetical protein